MKTTWCRQDKTYLGSQSPSDKRWRCPDCKQRFVVCCKKIDGGELCFWGPAHKKRVKQSKK